MTLQDALNDSLGSNVPRELKAAAALADLYARTLDTNEELLEDLGPKYLATLGALGLTVDKRGKGVTSDDNDPAREELDAIRQDRATALHSVA